MRKRPRDSSVRLGRARLLVGLAAGITTTAALAATALTITPTSHDFGDQGVGIAGNWAGFDVTLPTGAGAGDTLEAQIQGADASEFYVDRGAAPTPDPRGLIPRRCFEQWRTGACYYSVTFRPSSTGVKTATLIVADTRGNRATAALKGRGVAVSCRPDLVPCNYAGMYSGTFEVHSVQTISPDGTQVYTVGQNEESITIHVEKGKAWCRGFVRDTTTSLDHGRITSWSITEGTYDGEGLFAVEFGDDENGRLAYRVSYACPHWQGSTRGENITYSPPDKIVEPFGETIPFEPADWRDALEGEFVRIRAIGDDLAGTEKIPNDDEAAGPGVVTGWITFKWSLKVSQ